MSIFSPDVYLSRVSAINLDKLASQGITTILIDRDNTVVSRDTNGIDPDNDAWLKECIRRGFTLCFISNNWFASEVAQTAQNYGVQCVSRAMKPAPFALLHTMKKLGSTKDTTIFVGDQLMTDCAAAHLSGLKMYLVRPLAKKDMFYTYAFRFFERRILADATPEDEL